MGKKSAKSVDYEAILSEIGEFGPWQKKIIVMLWIPSGFCGLMFMVYSFALGTPSQYR